MKPVINESDLHHQYKAEIVKVMENEPYAQFLGIRLMEINEGKAIAELDVENHMLNSHGTVHGAVTFAIADYVFAAASNSYGKTSVGISNTVNYMAAGKKGTRLQATAIEEKKNHRMAWYKIKVESEDELIATMEALAYRKNHYFVPVD
ncbi:hotdog fold thioesterase [Halobacillus shinanisalinarum]|uniref:Hotdog fold thioesterase n=1 Tax=Halobacillus shinanisalinarum TaxID=2932258 RepID=A0ABY4GWL6_9BACI|nr:hotdog fold thioesterase [Halobacillus shinanisalinarum]UOQ92439.1 hotdog fold thioesterase [Halobacillus shinanisalinarum]